MSVGERVVGPGRGGRLGLRLIWGIPVILLLLLALGVVSILALRSVRDASAAINGELQETTATNTLLKAFQDSRAETLEAAALDTATGDNIDEMKAADAIFDSTFGEFRAAEAAAATNLSQAPELDVIEAAVGRYRQIRDTRLLPAITVGEPQAADVTDLGAAAADVLKAVDVLLAKHASEAAAFKADAASTYTRSRGIVLALLIVSMVVGVLIALFLVRKIARGIQSLLDAARGLREGELDRRATITSSDELGQLGAEFNAMADRLQGRMEDEREARAGLERAIAAYAAFAKSVAGGDLTARVIGDGTGDLAALATDMNAMAGSLGDLSGQVKGAALEMAGASNQILAVVSQHSSSANEQAAAIAQTSITVDEVRGSANHTAERAEGVATRAREAVRLCDEGAASADRTIERMGELQQRVEQIAGDIVALARRTEAIGSITQTVSDLADQSNMLSLNATIEAAKAGEHGKGFAVVAQEVGHLAEQSKLATEQVRAILAEVQSGTGVAVSATEEGVKVVQEGVAEARRAGDAIRSLADVIRGTATSATEIAASVREQSVGVDQIGQAMAEINISTSQIAAGALQSQVAAERLTDVAARLEGLVSRYRVE